MRRVVNTSTGGAIYGEGKVIPAPEDHPVAPESPYGQSKFCAEGYCDLYARMHGLSAVSLRYGNVYGPRQDPLGEAGVVAIFCGLLLDGKSPTVFGDGLQTRDYVYVGDVVAPTWPPPTPARPARSTSAPASSPRVLDIVATLAEHSTNGFEPELAPARPGEVRHIALEASRARAELDWAAQVPLATGLERTLDVAALGPTARPAGARPRWPSRRTTTRPGPGRRPGSPPAPRRGWCRWRRGS